MRDEPNVGIFVHHVRALRYCFRILHCAMNSAAVARRAVPFFVGLISIAARSSAKRRWYLHSTSEYYSIAMRIPLNRYAHSAGPIIDSLLWEMGQGTWDKAHQIPSSMTERQKKKWLAEQW